MRIRLVIDLLVRKRGLEGLDNSFHSRDRSWRWCRQTGGRRRGLLVWGRVQAVDGNTGSSRYKSGSSRPPCSLALGWRRSAHRLSISVTRRSTYSRVSSRESIVAIHRLTICWLYIERVVRYDTWKGLVIERSNTVLVHVRNRLGALEVGLRNTGERELRIIREGPWTKIIPSTLGTSVNLDSAIYKCTGKKGCQEGANNNKGWPQSQPQYTSNAHTYL